MYHEEHCFPVTLAPWYQCLNRPLSDSTQVYLPADVRGLLRATKCWHDFGAAIEEYRATPVNIDLAWDTRNLFLSHIIGLDNRMRTLPAGRFDGAITDG